MDMKPGNNYHKEIKLRIKIYEPILEAFMGDTIENYRKRTI